MLKNIFKGMVIGIASILPGVSGGILAVSMGIYDKLIHCISHFFSDIKQNIVFLLPLAIGVGIAIAASVFGIDYFFETFPIQTNCLFIGLIMGSLPTIYGKVKTKSVKVGHIITTVIFFVLIIGMALMNGTSGRTVTIDKNFTQILILFVIGIVASATMVVPGVSGSMILLSLGYYNPILDTIKEFMVSIFHFDMQGVAGTLYVLIPFGLGILIGFVVIARAIEWVFLKYATHAYWAIMGLLIASPIAIVIAGDFPKITVVRVLVGIVTFSAGWGISRKLGD